MADTLRIAITPTDVQWLKVAASILAGREDATEIYRKAAARELERLAYRAQLAREKGEGNG